MGPLPHDGGGERPDGFEPPASGPVLLSCGEVAALCLRAARGAVLSWGLAEEVGHAARWLHERSIDGPAALLARLETGATVSPVASSGGVLRFAEGNPLCPLAAGAALSDFASLSPARVTAGAVVEPVLLLPFVHQLARTRDCAMSVVWRGGRVEVAASGALAGSVDAIGADGVAGVVVEPAPGALAAPVEHRTYPTRSETIARLNAFAMLTTVPASAASRTDAGAGIADND